MYYDPGLLLQDNPVDDRNNNPYLHQNKGLLYDNLHIWELNVLVPGEKNYD
jgi:hypothetical protein